MGDGVRFRPERPSASDQGLFGLAALFLLVAGALAFRAAWTPSPPQGLPVEVTGAVAEPGLHLVEPATLSAAVEAAGGLSDGVPDTPLHAGDAVHVAEDGVRVVPAGNPLLVALPVDVNTHGTEALAAVPGLTPALAEALVADRHARGPFYAIDDLERVPGLSAGRLDEVAPFLTVGRVGPRPRIDLNRDPASVLADLPGIGPVLAARIVAHRDTHGPFADLAALDAVSGVGPTLIHRLDGEVEVGP